MQFNSNGYEGYAEWFPDWTIKSDNGMVVVLDVNANEYYKWQGMYNVPREKSYYLPLCDRTSWILAG